MKITENKVVSIAYMAKKENENGDIVDQTGKENPLRFIFGKGQLLKVFEDNLEGLSINDTFEFYLSPEDAYGPVYEEAIAEVPYSLFNQNKEILYIGSMVSLSDQQGRIHKGVIKDIEDTHVTIDFNHPLAGIGLFFRGEVIDVRDATEKELLALNHPHSCNCGCDDNLSDDNCRCDDDCSCD